MGGPELEESLNRRLDMYFSKVRVAAKDKAAAAVDELVNFFTPDAVIDADGKESRGQEAVRNFYVHGSLALSGFYPHAVEGSRSVVHKPSVGIQVDIFLHSDGVGRIVRDVFR